MSLLKVNTIQSYTDSEPLVINDELQLSGSTASGSKSVALGQNNNANALGSVAMGRNNTIEGSYAVTTGYAVTASSAYSYAGGLFTETKAQFQTVIGKHNAPSTNEADVFIIGAGENSLNKKNLAVFNSSGSIIFDTASIPTSDPAVLGQLYRTGSNLDEIKISFG